MRRQTSEQQPAHNVMASRALGLPGFVVLSAAEYGGELEQLVETVEVEAFCRSCGVRAVAHGRRPTWVRDLACGGRPTVLTWHKRIWRCPEPRCATRTWTETSEAIRARSVLTERARVQACRRVGQDATDVAAVAAELGVGWPTVMRAVVEYGTQLLDAAARDRLVSMLGVDETAFLKATATSPTRFATGLVDLRPAGGGPARLLDVVEGRSGRVLSDWIDAQGEAFTRGVQVAALDPFRGYHTALTSRLEYATAVLDPFHVVRLLTSAVDEVRRRVQNDTLGHRGRKGDPLYGIRRVLLRGAERHTPASWARLLAGVDAGDSGGQLAQVWIALQDLRHVYGAVSIDQARHRLHRFYWRCATAGVPELTRVARTISAWQDELLAYFTTGGASNGPTEAVNLLIKRIKRVGFGFRNFANYRLRLLLHCGITWHHRSTTRIRGRKPRSTS